MNEDSMNDPVVKLLRLLADRLESYLEGDDLAFDTLGEILEQEGLSGEEIQATVMVLRSMCLAESGAAEGLDGGPGKGALRVPSAEERALLRPEAWGYLLWLQRRGSLDAEQFERVIEQVVASGVRPVGVDQVREVATRVALQVDYNEEPGEPHGAYDLPN